MSMPILKVGSKISIISRANVRYEGVFVEIDTENLQIALSNVRFFGTETRAADFYIAPQARTYPYVLFKSTDIRDIRVINKPEVKEANDSYADEFSQQTFEFFRMTPFLNPNSGSVVNNPKFITPNESKLEARRAMLIRCNQSYRGGQRVSPYSWRIPPVVDYVGRSGDPTQLPLEFGGETERYDKEYDFEKYNRLFVDLCYGFSDLNLSIEDDDVNADGDGDGDGDGNKQESVQKAKEANQSLLSDTDKSSVADAIVVADKSISDSDVSSTTAPNKINVYSSKGDSSVAAYDKSKSFFDSVSCSSIYRSPYSNPNWREWNRETFGVPMVRHQRRSRRALFGANKSDDAVKLDSSVEKEAEKSPTTSEATENQEKITVQKIQFKAVIYTKSRGGKGDKKSSNVLPIEDVVNPKAKTGAKQKILRDVTNQQKETTHNVILKKDIEN